MFQILIYIFFSYGKKILYSKMETKEIMGSTSYPFFFN